MKECLQETKFAWNARWPGLSCWSNATLASTVNSEKLVWLELSGITPASATSMLIVRKKINECAYFDLLIPGTVLFFPKDCVLEE